MYFNAHYIISSFVVLEFHLKNLSHQSVEKNTINAKELLSLATKYYIQYCHYMNNSLNFFYRFINKAQTRSILYGRLNRLNLISFTISLSSLISSRVSVNVSYLSSNRFNNIHTFSKLNISLPVSLCSILYK